MIGQTISHYTILEKLGQGGMGVVYKAQDTRLLRQVAIKILLADLMADERKRRRFIREAQTASSLNHPNICTIYDIDEAGGMHFMVMELVEGETLRERLERHGALPEAEAIEIAIKVCDALAAVHAMGIFHRDIKPENIMISRQGFVKVMDFGLAKLATETAEAAADLEIDETSKMDAEIRLESYFENVVLTNLSGLLGTVHYMSPEQAQGKAIDQRSDIFSLGVVLFELLSGKRPFEGESNLTVLSGIIHHPPEPWQLRRGEVSPRLEQVLDRCLAKDSANRHQHVEEMREALRSLTTTELTTKWTPQEEQRPFKTRAANPEAYENYVRGVVYFDNLTPMNLQKSRECLELAITHDPDFAPAHAELAKTLALMGFTSWLPPKKVFPEAWAEAAKALTLDETLAEAHAVLGMVKFLFEWDRVGGEEEINHAIALNPPNAVARDVYAFYLTAMGQHDESITQIQRALAMAPSFYHNLRLGWSYYMARRYDEAIAQLQKTNELYPELNAPHPLLSWCYSKKGMYAEALADCAKSRAKGMPDWQCGWVYAESGKTEEARKVLEVLALQENISPVWLAEICLALGEYDRAFELFEKAYEARSAELMYLKVAPQFDAMRSDPRYFALLKKVGLEN